MKKKKNASRNVLIVAVFCFIILAFLGISLKLFNPDKGNIQNGKYNREGIENNEYSWHIDVSENSLYVSKHEREYTEYSQLTEITFMDMKYYIDDGILIRDENGKSEEVDLGGEKAKYLAHGMSSCSGSGLFVLTVNGNVFKIDMSLNVEKRYSGGDATEILVISYDYEMFSTCNYYSPYALIKNKLYYIGYLDNKTIVEREKMRPYSLILSDYSYKKYLLYPDGSINKYAYYGDPNNHDTLIPNEFITDDSGKKVLINFVFYLDKNLYLVDVTGKTYTITLPAIDNTYGHVEFKLSRATDFDIIKAIDLKYTKKYDIDKETVVSYSEMITFTFENDNQKTYSTDIGDDLSYNTSYYFEGKH